MLAAKKPVLLPESHHTSQKTVSCVPRDTHFEGYQKVRPPTSVFTRITDAMRCNMQCEFINILKSIRMLLCWLMNTMTSPGFMFDLHQSDTTIKLKRKYVCANVRLLILREKSFNVIYLSEKAAVRKSALVFVQMA